MGTLRSCAQLSLESTRGTDEIGIPIGFSAPILSVTKRVQGYVAVP